MLFLSLRVSRAVDHLEQTPVRHLLEHSDSCLLTRIEQRTDGVQELYLIRLQVRIGFIEFTDGMQDFIVCAIRALNQRPELLHDFQSARTNLKPVFDVLLYNRSDFCELFRIGLDDAVKLGDVEIQDVAFNFQWRLPLQGHSNAARQDKEQGGINELFHCRRGEPFSAD